MQIKMLLGFIFDLVGNAFFLVNCQWKIGNEEGQVECFTETFKGIYTFTAMSQ